MSDADVPDLLAPVGPSSRNVPDLLAPVGPSSRNVPDLLAPVGPTSRNVPDLLAPVGPTSRNVPDLLTPVGPTSRNVPDLLTPVGPTSSKNVPDLLAPVGPRPTKGVDLPAPKGFFDDVPPPKPGGGTRSGPPGTAMGLDAPGLSLEALDSLDLMPANPVTGTSGRTVPAAGPPRVTGAVPSLDLLPPPAASPSAHGGGGPGLDLSVPDLPGGSGLSLDSLDLVPGGDGGKSGPRGATSIATDGLDLEPPPSSAGSAPAGVISFGKPSVTVATVSASAGRGAGAGAAPSNLLDLAEPARASKSKKAPATMADDFGAPEAGVAAVTTAGSKPAASKRSRTIVAAVLGVVLLGGGGAYFVKTRLDASAALAQRIKTGLTDTRKLMVSDEAEHWDRAFKSAQKVLEEDRKNPDALGLAAQAQYAWALDAGHDLEARRQAGDAVMNDAIKHSADGAELEKARALALVLDEKAGDAQRTLETLQSKVRDGDTSLFLGWAALEAGDDKAAKAAFTAALKAHKDRIPALYGLGQAQLALGETADARASFDKVLAKRTNHVGAWVGLASMLPRDRVGTRERRFMEIVNSEQAATAHPRDVSRAWAFAGDEAISARRWDDASFRYKKAEDFDADNVDAITGRGLALLAQGNAIEARKLFEDVNRRDAKHVRALVGLTRLALLDDKWPTAKELVDQALVEGPDDPAVQLWYARVMEQAPGPAGLDEAITAYKRAAELDPGNYEPVVSLSLLYLKMGKNDEALATLSSIQKEAEGDAFLANTLGLAYLSAGNLDRAEAWFRGALAVEPGNVDAHANLGQTLEKRGNLAAALVEIETAYKTDPTREDVAIQLALAYERARRPADAEKLYLAMIDEQDGTPPTVAGRAAAGRYYAARGDAKTAGQQGAAILAEDAHHPAGLFLRGVSLLDAGNNSDAQKDLAEAVAIDPQPQYYQALGRSYEAQNQLDDALVQYSTAIDIDKRYDQPLVDRARVRQKRREWTQSLDDLQAARALDDRRADVYLMIGDAHFEMGDKRASVAPYQGAIARDGKNAEAYFKLGRAHYDLDRAGEAVAQMRRAVDLAAPDAEWLPDAYLILGFTLRSSGAKAESCNALRKYLDVAPPTAAARSDVKQQLLSCP